MRESFPSRPASQRLENDAFFFAGVAIGRPSAGIRSIAVLLVRLQPRTSSTGISLPSAVITRNELRVSVSQEMTVLQVVATSPSRSTTVPLTVFTARWLRSLTMIETTTLFFSATGGGGAANRGDAQKNQNMAAHKSITCRGWRRHILYLGDELIHETLYYKMYRAASARCRQRSDCAEV